MGPESRLEVRAVDPGSWVHNGVTVALRHGNETVKSKLQEADSWPGGKGGGREILGRGASEKCCRGQARINQPRAGSGGSWKEGLDSDVDSNQMGCGGEGRKDPWF